jgi:hypothetical protein
MNLYDLILEKSKEIDNYYLINNYNKIIFEYTKLGPFLHKSINLWLYRTNIIYFIII